MEVPFELYTKSFFQSVDDFLNQETEKGAALTFTDEHPGFPCTRLKGTVTINITGDTYNSDDYFKEEYYTFHCGIWRNAEIQGEYTLTLTISPDFKLFFSKDGQPLQKASGDKYDSIIKNLAVIVSHPPLHTIMERLYVFPGFSLSDNMGCIGKCPKCIGWKEWLRNYFNPISFHSCLPYLNQNEIEKAKVLRVDERLLPVLPSDSYIYPSTLLPLQRFSKEYPHYIDEMVKMWGSFQKGIGSYFESAEILLSNGFTFDVFQKLNDKIDKPWNTWNWFLIADTLRKMSKNNLFTCVSPLETNFLTPNVNLAEKIHLGKPKPLFYSTSPDFSLKRDGITYHPFKSSGDAIRAIMTYDRPISFVYEISGLLCMETPDGLRKIIFCHKDGNYIQWYRTEGNVALPTEISKALTAKFKDVL